MSRPWIRLFGAVIILAAGSAPSAFAQDRGRLDEIMAVARGGLFFDNWYEALALDPPAETHPAYPTEGRQAAAATWRCKECHGWDYKGVDGAYGEGSHFTGIKGIRDMAGADPVEIIGIIRNERHGYGNDLLNDSVVADLAMFISQGQVDMDQFIDPVTGTANGDAGAGARQYLTMCRACHGPNGKRFNFGSEDEPEFVGTIANDNPWELLHKIRNGQPGVPMIALSLTTFSVEDQIDILTYAQTLPVD